MGAESVRRRRFLGVTAAAAGAALTATGCGGGGGSGSGEGALRLVAAEYGQAVGVSSTERYWEEVVRGFRRGHQEIGVDVSVARWQDASAEVSRLVEKGQAPDIAQIASFADFAAADQLYRADELLSLPQLADFVPSLARAGQRLYDQYGLPFASMTWRLYYNQGMFEDAGLDPESPPRDWEELLDVASALRDAGVRVPFALPLGHGQAVSEAALWMMGGDGGIADATGNYAIDAYANVETFTWLRDDLVAASLTGGGQPSALSRDQAYADFAQGIVGMVFGNPLLARQAAEADVPFGTAPPPGATGPLPSTLGEASWILALNQRENEQEIGTFLRYVFGSGSVTSFAEHYGLLPVTVPATEALRERGEPSYLLPFLDDLPSATFHPVWKVSWARVASSIGEGIGRALEPGSDILGVLGELQVEAEAADRAAGE
jgi:multiple sugar transport system substrate-binding protein